jgi:regulator of replication initiation timing
MENNNTNTNKSLRALLILLFILLLGTGGLSVWQFFEHKKIEDNLQIVQTELKVVSSEKDSLDTILKEYEERLSQLEQERSELANYSVGLEDEVQNLKKNIANLRSRLANASPEQMAKLKLEIAELGNKTAQYENKINELMEENEILRKVTKDLTDENTTLTVVNKTLDDKVRKASEAQFAPVQVITGRMRKKGFEEEVKIKRVEEIQIHIDVIENPIVTDVTEQQIAIRIIDPNKGVLTKLQDNKQLVDKSEIFTIKHSFNFDGKAKKIVLKFEPETKLVKGTYKVEFWAKDELKQTGKFELN